MSQFDLNVSIDSIIAQKERNEVKNTQKVFDEKNYLQTRLSPSQTSKEMTIRLLPFDKEATEFFHEVYFHQVRVNEKVSPSGWKSYPCPVKNKMGDKCPFCEMAKQASLERNQTLDEVEKKYYTEIIKNNLPKKMYIVRCIERGKEEDGVKFWKFSHSLKKDGVYDKIISIFQMRLAKAQSKGDVYSIFDLNNGKDLNLVITKDSNGRNVINITDDDEKTPLTDDIAKGMSWINDEKTWDSVYATKPYDFMKVILDGGVPVYDKENGCYTSVNELERRKQIKQDAEAMETNVNQFESIPNVQVMKVEIEDEDLPF